MRADDDNAPKKRTNRAMMHEEFPPTSRRQVQLADMLSRKGKKRKAPKVPAATRRTRDAAMRQAQRSTARGY